MIPLSLLPSAGFDVADYLFPTPLAATDWTITNPPFRLAEDFIARALDLSEIGCAMLVALALTLPWLRWPQGFRDAGPLIAGL